MQNAATIGAERRPFVNYTFISINVLVFLFLQQAGNNDAFTYAFALVPKEIITSPLSHYFNFLSSIFIHSDVIHLFGNLAFVWIFGDEVEKLLGHVRYAFFYLACGVIAGAAQIAIDPESILPIIGSSGAVAALFGAYFALFPRGPVTAFIFNAERSVPAYAAFGVWIAYQLVAAYLAPPETGGVAYGSHIGGFAAGAVLAAILVSRAVRQRRSRNIWLLGREKKGGDNNMIHFSYFDRKERN